MSKSTLLISVVAVLSRLMSCQAAPVYDLVIPKQTGSDVDFYNDLENSNAYFFRTIVQPRSMPTVYDADDEELLVENPLAMDLQYVKDGPLFLPLEDASEPTREAYSSAKSSRQSTPEVQSAVPQFLASQPIAEYGTYEMDSFGNFYSQPNSFSLSETEKMDTDAQSDPATQANNLHEPSPKANSVSPMAQENAPSTHSTYFNSHRKTPYEDEIRSLMTTHIKDQNDVTSLAAFFGLVPDSYNETKGLIMTILALCHMKGAERPSQVPDYAEFRNGQHTLLGPTQSQRATKQYLLKSLHELMGHKTGYNVQEMVRDILDIFDMYNADPSFQHFCKTLTQPLDPRELSPLSAQTAVSKKRKSYDREESAEQSDPEDTESMPRTSLKRNRKRLSPEEKAQRSEYISRMEKERRATMNVYFDEFADMLGIQRGKPGGSSKDLGRMIVALVSLITERTPNFEIAHQSKSHNTSVRDMLMVACDMADLPKSSTASMLQQLLDFIRPYQNDALFPNLLEAAKRKVQQMTE